MPSNNYKPACDFSGEIISYLYGEISPREKDVFEGHLLKCSNCADELAALSETHLAIGDWRETHFAGLESPQIVIPYDESPLGREPFNESRSRWAAKLREFLSFSLFRPATAVLTALSVLIVVGAVLTLSRQFGNSPDAAAAAKFETTASSGAATAKTPVAIENQPVQSEAKNEKNTATAKDFVVEKKPSSAAVRRSSNKSALTDLRASNGMRKSLKLPGGNRLTGETVAGNSDLNKKISPLNVDDEEISDDSLRLSELFDETDGEN